MFPPVKSVWFISLPLCHLHFLHYDSISWAWVFSPLLENRGRGFRTRLWIMYFFVSSPCPNFFFPNSVIHTWWKFHAHWLNEEINTEWTSQGCHQQQRESRQLFCSACPPCSPLSILCREAYLASVATVPNIPSYLPPSFQLKCLGSVLIVGLLTCDN